MARDAGGCSPSGPPAAIILTGGAGRRLAAVTPPQGGKAACRFRGEPLRHWVAAAVAPVARDLFLVGGQSPSVAWLQQFPGAVHVPDRVPGAGPLAGLHDGLVAVTQHRQRRGEPLPWGVAFLACDLPLLTPAILAGLFAQVPCGAALPQWVIPVVDSRPQYLCSIIRPGVRDRLETFLHCGRRDLRGFAEALAAEQVAAVTLLAAECWQQIDPGGVVAEDVDTPDDLVRVSRFGFAAGSPTPYTPPGS